MVNHRLIIGRLDHDIDITGITETILQPVKHGKADGPLAGSGAVRIKVPVSDCLDQFRDIGRISIRIQVNIQSTSGRIKGRIADLGSVIHDQAVVEHLNIPAVIDPDHILAIHIAQNLNRELAVGKVLVVSVCDKRGSVLVNNDNAVGLIIHHDIAVQVVEHRRIIGVAHGDSH